MKGRHQGGAGDLDGFFADYRAETFVNPINPRERVWVLPGDHYVVTCVYPFDGRAHLSSIISADRGGGHASNVLDRLCALADRHEIALDLTPKPFGRGGLNKQQLRAWYASRGFQSLRGYAGLLVRPPRGSA